MLRRSCFSPNNVILQALGSQYPFVFAVYLLILPVVPVFREHLMLSVQLLGLLVCVSVSYRVSVHLSLIPTTADDPLSKSTSSQETIGTEQPSTALSSSFCMNTASLPVTCFTHSLCLLQVRRDFTRGGVIERGNNRI